MVYKRYSHERGVVVRRKWQPIAKKLLPGVCASGANHDERPTPWDFTLCIKCGAVLQFDDNMKLVESDWTKGEDNDQRFYMRHVQQVIRRVRAEES